NLPDIVEGGLRPAVHFSTLAQEQRADGVYRRGVWAARPWVVAYSTTGQPRRRRDEAPRGAFSGAPSRATRLRTTIGIREATCFVIQTICSSTSSRRSPTPSTPANSRS